MFQRSQESRNWKYLTPFARKVTLTQVVSPRLPTDKFLPSLLQVPSVLMRPGWARLSAFCRKNLIPWRSVLICLNESQFLLIVPGKRKTLMISSFDLHCRPLTLFSWNLRLFAFECWAKLFTRFALVMLYSRVPVCYTAWCLISIYMLHYNPLSYI